MRKPSEYIASAIRNVRSSLMPDCIATLAHGAYCAEVTRVGTASRGDDGVADVSPVESARVLALASDFPFVSKDDSVTLDGEMRIVTSVRTDPSRSSMTIGMSGVLTKYAATVTGARPRGGSVRLPVELLANDNGLATEYGDGLSPTTVHAWTVLVHKEVWHDAGAPEIGDELRLDAMADGGYFVDHGIRLRVSRVTERETHWIIAARSRE